MVEFEADTSKHVREDGLVEQLRALNVKRIAIDKIRACYFELYPELLDHPERNQHLRLHLDTLVGASKIVYPSKNRRNWSPDLKYPLPRWILIANKTKVPVIDPCSIAWVQELSFCTTLRNRSQLQAAIRINDFLIVNRASLTDLLPVRERSLQIFGDEKRLDALTSKDSLFGGRFPLSAIGAFTVAPPIPFESSGSPDLKILVVENHNTYWSMCKWNARTHRYSAVAWGGGNTVLKHAEGIVQLENELGARGIEYFGDIDYRGLQILHELVCLLKHRYTVWAEPAHEFYEWLLLNGCQRNTDGEVELERISILTAPHFHPETAHLINQLITSGYRVPQESLNTNVLREWLSASTPDAQGD